MGRTTTQVPARKTGHMTRLAAGVVPLVLLASVGLAGRAEAAGPAVECGTTLTVDTRLTRDLYCPSGNGLTLGPNVELNLSGHRLVGPGSSGTGIASTAGNVSIRNGEVRNWAIGIGIQGGLIASGAEPSVTGVVLRNAPSILQFGSRLTLARVIAIDSPVRGELAGDLKITHSRFIRSSIGVYEASAAIARSTLVASTLDGFGTYASISVDRSRLDGRGTTRLADMYEAGITITNSTVKNYRDPISGYYSGATITNSTFTDMPGGVLGRVGSGLGSEGISVIRGNTFTRSGVVLDPHTPMFVERNVFRHNTEGAVFQGSTTPGSEMWAPGRAVNNLFVGNSSNGIRAEIPGLEVGRNTAKRNGGYGIYAPGAVDLGGNVAYGNKLGQCVGVVCSARK
jgi:parallel beta helix pectate lyase-like protein